MNKRIIVIIGIIFSIGVFLYILHVYSVQAFDYAGTLEATRIDLPARVATVVKKVLVEEGQKVQVGEQLIELGCEDLEITSRLIRDNYKRAIKLKQSGSISIENFDQAQNKQDEIEKKLSWCRVNSPVNGTVLTSFMEESEWVNPGSRLVTVADLSSLWAYFYVPQAVMGILKVGNDVKGQVPEIEQSFNGKIIKINEEAEFTPKNVQTQSERTRLVYGVKVKFDNSTGLLKPGMTIISNLKSK